MARYLPFILGVLLIVGLTIPQFIMTDRLAGTNVSAEQRAALLDKVPKMVGDWQGGDMPIDPGVRKTAGAIGAVQRDYRNVRTGEIVRLWLIVGHARDVSFHTPDVCYPASGFTARASENGLYPMVFGNEAAGAPFLTNTFLKEDDTGQHLYRVFWSWYNPENKANEGKVMWEAPHNARWHFGNTRALYKMYFHSAMRKADETAEQSSCVRFAREFLPEVNKALSQVYGGSPGQEAQSIPAEATSKPVAEQPSAESKSSANTTAPAEKATDEKAAPEAGKVDAPSAAKSVPEGEPAANPAADPLFESPKATK